MDSYLFPTGAIRELEKKLFDDNDLERMVDSSGADESFRIFNELSYADELLDVDSPDRYAEVLDHDLLQVKDFIMAITPQDSLKMLILARFDIQNFKILFKAQKFGVKDYDLTMISYVNPEKMKSIILDGDKQKKIPEIYEKLWEVAREDLDKVKDPAAIDRYFDKKYFEVISTLARGLKDSYLEGFIRKLIDIANIKVIVRAKLLALDVERAGEELVSDGDIGTDKLISIFGLGLSEFTRELGRLVSGEIKEGLEVAVNKNDMGALEKVSHDYRIDLLHEARIKSRGGMVIVSYFLAKRNAMRNLRVIMAGKLNNISAIELKTRVNKLY